MSEARETAIAEVVGIIERRQKEAFDLGFAAAAEGSRSLLREAMEALEQASGDIAEWQAFCYETPHPESIRALKTVRATLAKLREVVGKEA